MKTRQDLFNTIEAPEGLSPGIYSGFVMKSVPEVNEGDFVFGAPSSGRNAGNETLAPEVLANNQATQNSNKSFTGK